MDKIKKIELSSEEFSKFQNRVKGHNLEEPDYETISAMIEILKHLNAVVEKKNGSIKKLLKMIFGYCTESSKNILKNIGDLKSDAIKKSKPGINENKDDNDGKKKKGHGRNGADAYTGAEKIKVLHSELKRGDNCPGCLNGKVYPTKEPGITINLFAIAPVQAKIWEQEKLRCNLCGEIFTADLPEGAIDDKYDGTAGAMIALLKYGGGTPFYRLEQIQEWFGIPLPDATQWYIALNLATLIYPIYKELISIAAQGQVIYNDDTSIKILSLMNKNDIKLLEYKEPKERTGNFTSGIISEVGEHKIALFYSGQNHAGDNINTLLANRAKELPPPIQMCDASSRNIPKDFKTILANCLVHGRRSFVDQYSNFPEECRFVIEIFAHVYKNDEIAKNQNMSPADRLKFHQDNSAPLMTTLETWFNQQFNDKKIEPNSGMGRAISYMLKHWKPLTLFLKVEGAPLDNNICERALKKIILFRKNSLFFKTLNGALVGDIFMSIIHTCQLNNINPFDYLKTLQKNIEDVIRNPAQWMPWNYKEAVPP